MSSVAFGGARNQAPKPPEKGVFPLDHFGECTVVRRRSTSAVIYWGWISSNPTHPAQRTPGGCRSFSTYIDFILHTLQIKDEYLKCLATHKGDADECREVTKRYLKCRMERYVAVILLVGSRKKLSVSRLGCYWSYCIQELDGSAVVGRAWF